MTVTKKQSSLAFVAVLFATAMIVGTIASATGDNMAFAGGHGSHGKKGNHNKQSIGQSNTSSQSMNCSANGGSGFGSGSGLIGIGAGVGGLGGLNLCFNSNPQTNINQGQNQNVTSISKIKK